MFERAWRRFFRRVSGSVNIIFVGDKKIRQINKVYLDKDELTDVISFYYSRYPRASGDVFICLPQARRQSRGVHSVEKEIFFLMIHGFLHLLGRKDYSESDRKKMFALQEKIVESIFNK